ncbi:sulfotransferase domain-containing protein [Halopseudomonas salina]|nr:sulfotransferase domain-containing protein [Halopseudomonas salina]
MFFQNAFIRKLLIYSYTLKTRRKFTPGMPKIFLNSIPKSGTHLVTGLLSSTPGLINSGSHLETRLVNKRSEGNAHKNEKFDIDESIFQKQVCKLNEGHFFSAHLPYDPLICGITKQNNVSTIFLARHPGAIIISEYHYIVNLKRHFLHPTLTTQFNSSKDQIEALATGFEYLHNGTKYRQPSFEERMARFKDWRTEESTFYVQYEELMNDQKSVLAGNDSVILLNLFSHIGMVADQHEIAKIISESVNRKSFTKRKGNISGWKSELELLAPDSSVVEKSINQSATLLGY